MRKPKTEDCQGNARGRVLSPMPEEDEGEEDGFGKAMHLSGS